MIKKFNSVKVPAPLNADDLERAIGDLTELRIALIYWGKIILRQNKVKHIRKSANISKEEEFQGKAEEEEAFIFNEKKKFDGEDAAQQTNLKLDKLKVAQQIDKELRMQQAWNNDEADHDEEDHHH